MPPRITDSQRKAVLALLAQGLARETVAAQVGVDAETDEEVFWHPDPSHGAVNPHMLILGESGFGKTYAICCLLAELAQSQIPSIVFDYGQGFATGAPPRHFIDYAKAIEIKASHEGVAINPLQLFPSDIHSPVNVAQRVADTFQCVYAQIGVQQHTILRQAVLDVMDVAMASATCPVIHRLASDEI